MTSTRRVSGAIDAIEHGDWDGQLHLIIGAINSRRKHTETPPPPKSHEVKVSERVTVYTYGDEFATMGVNGEAAVWMVRSDGRLSQTA